MNIKPMPIIVGSPRSGTTLLRLMLDSHPDLAIPPETGFLGVGQEIAGSGEELKQNFFQTLTHFPPDAPGCLPGAYCQTWDTNYKMSVITTVIPSASLRAGSEERSEEGSAFNLRMASKSRSLTTSERQAFNVNGLPDAGMA